MGINDITGYAQMQFNFTAGRWIKVRAVFAENLIRMFVDDGSGLNEIGRPWGYMNDIVSTNIGLAIGHDLSQPNAAFAGLIDEVKIYNTSIVSSLSSLPAPPSYTYPLSYPLLAHWKLDERIGATVALDSSGNNLNGNLTSANDVTWIFGYNYGAARIINNQILVANSSLLNPNKTLVLEAWVYRESLNTLDGCIISKGLNGAQYELTIANDNIRFKVGSFVLTTTGVLIPTRSWYFIRAIYENNVTMNIYVNGVNRTNPIVPVGAINQTTAPLSIGNYPPGSTINNVDFNGVLDEVKVFGMDDIIPDTNMASTTQQSTQVDTNTGTPSTTNVPVTSTTQPATDTTATDMTTTNTSDIVLPTTSTSTAGINDSPQTQDNGGLVVVIVILAILLAAAIAFILFMIIKNKGIVRQEGKGKKVEMKKKKEESIEIIEKSE